MRRRIRAAVGLGLPVGVAVGLGVRLLGNANTPPPEPIGGPTTSSWWIATGVGVAVALVTAAAIWFWSANDGFFDEDGEEDDEARAPGG